MKGEKGICMAGTSPNEVRRTKFSSEKACKEAFENLKEIGVIPVTYVVYQCKECGMWHIGKESWAKQFGK